MPGRDFPEEFQFENLLTQTANSAKTSSLFFVQTREALITCFRVDYLIPKK